MTGAAAVQLAITMVRVEKLQPSPTNPRKTFADIEELAASIKAHGIQVPLIVRQQGKAHEIVAGERRWRAAKKAGLEEVPALVRELTDLEVIEVQLIENAQRSDVHPVEEAEAYRTLHQVHKLSADEIAAKVGKSKSHVYGRMKLAELAEPVRKAALAGELPATHALLLARIPASLQEDALKQILDGYGSGEPMTFREAQDFVVKSFTLRLADAKWDLKDEQLVPVAGSCSKCPKRTGNQPELFADVKAKDICTDKACFDEKRRAHVQLQVRRAEVAGNVAIAATAEQALKGGNLVDLDGRQYIDGKGWTTLRAALGKKAGKLETAIAPTKDGLEVKELVSNAEVDKLLGRDKEVAARLAENEKYKRAGEKDRAKREQEKQARAVAIVEIVAAAEQREFGKAIWFEIAGAQLSAALDGAGLLPDDLLLRRIGRKNIEDGDAEDDEKELRSAMAKMSLEQLRGFAIELMMLNDDHVFGRRDDKNLFSELKRMYGVGAKKPAKAKKKPAAKKKKPKSAKKAKK